jgi:hypothetical protein
MGEKAPSLTTVRRLALRLQLRFLLTPVAEVPVRGKGEIEVWELTARGAPAPLLGG